LGIGGGKDSALAGELLKAANLKVIGFTLTTGTVDGQAPAVAEVMKVPLQTIERTIDPLLLELNRVPGAYNGHVPVSVIFALVGCIMAVQTGAATVAVANEASASIPRIGEVNHQWSKSLEFELLFQDYLSSIVSDLTYLSPIRSLNSVGVASLFSEYPAYHQVFTSDNYVFRIAKDGRPAGRWGLESAKTLSSFMLLSPWLDEAQLAAIFEYDLARDSSLLPLARRLIGTEGTPPLDCVGTPEELTSSLRQAFKQGKFADTVLRTAIEANLPTSPPLAELATVRDTARRQHWILDTIAPFLERKVTPR
jgi:hypothetical protein